MQLSEMEQDAISEMLNLGIGSAVTAMSTMVQNQVTISIPRLNFVKNKDYKIIDAISDNSCIIVSVNVQRELQGQLSLIIPESDTAKTARAIIQMQMDDKTLSGIENDVIAEMGNIVLHAIIGAISDFLKLKLITDTPQVERGQLNTFLKKQGTDNFHLHVDIDFGVPDLDIIGMINLSMKEKSIKLIQKKIQLFLSKYHR